MCNENKIIFIFNVIFNQSKQPDLTITNFGTWVMDSSNFEPPPQTGPAANSQTFPHEDDSVVFVKVIIPEPPEIIDLTEEDP